MKSGHGHLMVGLGGSQGSGKMTLSKGIRYVFSKGLELKSIAVSVDA